MSLAPLFPAPSVGATCRRPRAARASSTALLALWLPLSAGCSRPAAPGEAPEGYARLQLAAPGTDLDPHHTWDADATAVFGALFDPLYYTEPDGTLTPNLASELPRVSADGTTLRIGLRAGVRFHDDACFPDGRGREVTAEDFVYSFRRVAQPENTTGLFGLLQSRVAGVASYREARQKKQAGFDAPIEGLRAVGERELEIRLVRPEPSFPLALSVPNFSAVPREAVERYGEQFSRHPVGTGAYALERWSDREIVLRRVPGHWSVSASAPPGLVFRYFDDPWSAFRGGALDQVQVSPRNLFAYVDRALALKPDLREAGFQLLRVPTPQVRFLVFNYRNPLFADVRVRRAVALGVPWCSVLSQTEECSGSVVPRGVAGSVALPRAFAPARAREELAAAGHAAGEGIPELVIRYRGFTHDLRGAALVQDGLAGLGIRSRLEHREGRSMEGVDLGLLGWSLDYADAANVFELFHSRSAPPDGWNDGGFESPEYDRMLDAAARTAEPRARAQAYEQLNRWFDQNVVAVPFRQVDDFHALGRRVRSLTPDSMGYLDWATLGFKEAQP